MASRGRIFTLSGYAILVGRYTVGIFEYFTTSATVSDMRYRSRAHIRSVGTGLTIVYIQLSEIVIESVLFITVFFSCLQILKSTAGYIIYAHCCEYTTNYVPTIET